MAGKRMKSLSMAMALPLFLFVLGVCAQEAEDRRLGWLHQPAVLRTAWRVVRKEGVGFIFNTRSVYQTRTGLEKVMHNIMVKCLGLALVVSLPFAASAAKKIPMSDARYSGAAVVASRSPVAVTARTFDPEPQRWSSLAASPGAYAYVSGNVKEQFLFGATDQRELASILHAELVRLGIFQTASEESPDVVEVQLHFISGTYKRTINEYELSLEMTLVSSHGQRFTKRYVVNSNAKSTGWKKLNTSVWQGKMQLAQIALDTLIPDIERFLSENAAGEQPT